MVKVRTSGFNMNSKLIFMGFTLIFRDLFFETKLTSKHAVKGHITTLYNSLV